MTLSETPLRWGILGTANIARKNWQAIRHSGNGIINAMASRDIQRSRSFIAECQAAVPFVTVPKALGSYAELIESPEVDAVYIPLPTGVRKEWVLRAAAAGKHVVCEKPCAVSVGDLEEMLEACRRHRVQFMDGVMLMHSRRLGRMREILDDGTSLGRLKRVTSAFSFLAPEEFFATNIRSHGDLEPHGCLGDLGWYCLRLSLWAMNGLLPRAVTGRVLAQAGPVPTEFSGELLFDGGVSAGFHCSFLTGNEQWAILSGTRGSLQVPDFVLPFHGEEVDFEVCNTMFNVRGCDFEMQPDVRRVTVAEHSNSHPTAQESNLFRKFTDQVRSGRLDTTWPDMALKTQQVMQACLVSAQHGSRPVELA